MKNLLKPSTRNTYISVDFRLGRFIFQVEADSKQRQKRNQLQHEKTTGLRIQRAYIKPLKLVNRDYPSEKLNGDLRLTGTMNYQGKLSVGFKCFSDNSKTRYSLF